MAGKYSSSMEKSWVSDKRDRIDNILRERIPQFVNSEVSNSKIRRLIVAGAVEVNGRQVRVPGYEVHAGSRIRVFIEEEKLFFEKKPDDIEFVLDESNVLFEDESIIVVNKPAFLPTEDTIVQSRKSMHSAVVEYLWKKNPSLRNPPYAGIMHRLDRETSGVLLFTKVRGVNGAVHDMFENRTATKVYRAVCQNKNHLNAGTSFSVENHIGRVSPKSQQCKIGVLPESRGGQFARTEFYVADSGSDYCYVDCTLFTGRTHQIRVHLSGCGMPIVGDSLYGGPRGFDELNGRIMLHAKALTFPHPVTGEIMTVEAPLPKLFVH